MADLYTLLQDVSLLSDEGLAYYHKVVTRLIASNNTSIKQEIINQVNTDVSNTINSDVNAKIENLRTELTNASEEDLQALRTELIASIDSKQDKLTGSNGQIVMFNSEGNPVAANMPTGGAVGVFTKNFTASEFNSTTKILTIAQSVHKLKASGQCPPHNILCLVGGKYVNTWGSMATTVHWSGTNLLIEANEPFDGTITVIGESM